MDLCCFLFRFKAQEKGKHSDTLIMPLRWETQYCFCGTIKTWGHKLYSLINQIMVLSASRNHSKLVYLPARDSAFCPCCSCSSQYRYLFRNILKYFSPSFEPKLLGLLVEWQIWLPRLALKMQSNRLKSDKGKTSWTWERLFQITCFWKPYKRVSFSCSV